MRLIITLTYWRFLNIINTLMELIKKMSKLDPYAALSLRNLIIFLLIRFLLVLGWSMQFIIIEWEVYNLTKNPLALGLIGLVEIIPAISMSLFAGHIVDQKKRKKIACTSNYFFSVSVLSFFYYYK